MDTEGQSYKAMEEKQGIVQQIQVRNCATKKPSFKESSIIHHAKDVHR